MELELDEQGYTYCKIKSVWPYFDSTNRWRNEIYNEIRTMVNSKTLR